MKKFQYALKSDGDPFTYIFHTSLTFSKFLQDYRIIRMPQIQNFDSLQMTSFAELQLISYMHLNGSEHVKDKQQHIV